jgi:hypothetical protein
MFRYLAALAVLLFTRSASADVFYKLVGYQCEPEKDRIVISYRGAYNEEGEAMVKNKRPEEWQPESLIKSMRDDNHIGELETVHRTCKLKDGVYTVSIGTSPGNFNIQGRCGAHFSAWVEIVRGEQEILPHLEFEADCHVTAPVTTRVVVEAGGKEPSRVETPYDEFYR